MFPCIKPFVSPLQCSLALLLLTVLPARAQPAAAESDVEVTSVHFSPVPAPSGALTKNNWLEVNVEVNVKATPATQENRNFLNRVKMTVTLGFQVTVDKNKLSFYRASAEAVSLEVGRSNFRFYVPGEIVKRDSLAGEAKYYAVELAVGGKALTPQKSNYSTSSIPNLQTFLSKAAGDSSSNDGIMLPQFLTGYAFDNNRPSPTIVRPEAMAK